MGITDNKSIKCPNIILCEGMDAWSFLVNYLDFLVKKDTIFDTIQVIDFGGIKDLKRQFRQLTKMPGFSVVKSILILRDAEKDSQGAKESIRSTLLNSGFKAPEGPGQVVDGKNGPSIAYMLFPSCNEIGEENGTLEDLCLKIISESNSDEIREEVDKYLSVMKGKYSMEYPRIHKNILHLMISSYDKYVDAKAGEAGQRGMYDWDSIHLRKLRDLMYRMCN